MKSRSYANILNKAITILQGQWMAEGWVPPPNPTPVPCPQPPGERRQGSDTLVTKPGDCSMSCSVMTEDSSLRTLGHKSPIYVCLNFSPVGQQCPQQLWFSSLQRLFFILTEVKLWDKLLTPSLDQEVERKELWLQNISLSDLAGSNSVAELSWGCKPESGSLSSRTVCG